MFNQKFNQQQQLFSNLLTPEIIKHIAPYTSNVCITESTACSAQYLRKQAPALHFRTFLQLRTADVAVTSSHVRMTRLWWVQQFQTSSSSQKQLGTHQRFRYSSNSAKAALQHRCLPHHQAKYSSGVQPTAETIEFSNASDFNSITLLISALTLLKRDVKSISSSLREGSFHFSSTLLAPSSPPLAYDMINSQWPSQWTL